MADAPHFSVMLPEVLHYLSPRDDAVYVDGTFGAGGYTRAILKAANCRVIAIDRDPTAQHFATPIAQEFGDRFQLLQGCFGDVQFLLNTIGIVSIDGLILDLGVSSMQLDEAERGFSFRQDGPLDMRMGCDAQSEVSSAAQLVNHMDETELANLIWRYGEEKKSRAVARAIVKARAESPITRTLQLRDIIHSVIRVKPGKKHKQIDPATRTFQALRIAVNDELGEVERVLDAAPQVLGEDGKLVVVSFHSLEDRLVKRHMQICAGKAPAASRHAPEAVAGKAAAAPLYHLLHKGAVACGEAEAAENTRSRSAKLRAALRTSQPYSEPEVHHA